MALFITGEANTPGPRHSVQDQPPRPGDPPLPGPNDPIPPAQEPNLPPPKEDPPLPPPASECVD